VPCGGGLYLFDSTAAIIGNTIRNNSASAGGGLYAVFSSANLTRNLILANTAISRGGGLFLWDSPATITRNTIAGNRVVSSGSDNIADGGGLFLESASPVVANNAITGNSAAECGGGIYCSDSTASFLNNTITGNDAYASGGGISIGGASPIIVNTIVAFNSSGISGTGSSSTFRNNCVYGNRLGNFFGFTDPTGTAGNISVDPRLAGSSYGDWHLRPDSPCIGAGDNASASGPTDLDGQPRIQPAGGTVDIGAAESDGSVPPSGPPTIVRVSPTGDDAHDGSSWPLAKRTAQAALNQAAATGGEVWIQAGTYQECITLPARVHLYGGFAGTEGARDQRNWRVNVTVLDAAEQGTVVTAGAGYAVSSVDGFTITRGRATLGGGINLFGCSPTIANNTIAGNAATQNGGGLYLSSSCATISNNHIATNTASYQGGGLWMYQSSPVVASNAITNNTLAQSASIARGTGVYVDTSTPRILNCTLAYNSGSRYDEGALAVAYNSGMTVANTIVAYNSSGIRGDASTQTLRNNCVYGNSQGNYYGLSDPTGTNGNISVDPLLANREYAGWRLLPNSPCIGAGDNAYASGPSDVDGGPRIRPTGGTVDIGAAESDGNAPAPAPFVTIRVSPQGDDAYDGSSWSRAKRTVQAGIQAAAMIGGDVWVQAGTYEERITLPPFAHVYGGFAGTETARDQRDWQSNPTILDGRQQGSVVTCTAGRERSTLDGFTITGGNATNGGGVYLYSCTPTIAHNTIRANTAAALGGGLYSYGSPPVIVNNAFLDNSAGTTGGGLWVYGVPATIANNLIAGNSAPSQGGGFHLYASASTVAGNLITGNTGDGLYVIGSSATIVNNTITGNSGMGLYTGGFSPSITNTIVAFNASGVSRAGSATFTLRANCVFGNATYDYSGIADPTGTAGNISANPLFVQNPDPNTPGSIGDLHLQPGSPCINTGNNADVWGTTDLDGFARLVGPAVDMGAYEFGAAFYGDLDHDGDIDAADLALCANCLTGPGPDIALPPDCNLSDLDADSDVDLADFARLQTLAN
jgi:parallel beta-helix repeat protein